MKTIHRFFLWVLGLIMPVFIAACYGMPYGFTKTGRVLDKGTRKGVSGLRVVCVEQGQDWNFDRTGQDGSFYLGTPDSGCDSVRVEDTDGDDNGLYKETTVPFCHECDELEIEVEPAK